MPTILFIDYMPSEAQKSASGDEWQTVAQHISGIDGLRWKYWLRGVEDGTLGGVYLFETLDLAKAAAAHLEGSLTDAGARSVSLRFFDVDGDLSAITRGDLSTDG